MADTFTTLLGLRLQATGANENTWGELQNQDVIQPTEDAIAATNTHAVTGGALDLSADPMLEQVHIFSGTLSSDLTVTIPNLSKRMLVFNDTDGAFFMLMKTSAGTAICIPQGTMKDVYCDGADNVYRSDKDEVGEVKYFGNSAVPSGYFELDGSAKSRTLTLDLFGKIGTTWGVGNGATTYNIPDAYTAGKFLRSRTASVALGTAQTDSNKSHNHTASGTATTSLSGSVAAGGDHGHAAPVTDLGHTHTASSNQLGVSGAADVFPATGGSGRTGDNQTITINSAFTGISVTIGASGTHQHSISGVTATTTITGITVASDGGTEARPTNLSMILAIRY